VKPAPGRGEPLDSALASTVLSVTRLAVVVVASVWVASSVVESCHSESDLLSEVPPNRCRCG
jgi:hypothetical protein